ncbi:MVP [Cordylochernes scorpioides]|uniref:Major vault protein n=1 Tax=Cordylochernes scorpioides TaxID=51811 RepID=A0ABY6K3Z9_9ARAC|nr:MVP [Cordylochernes scorpioides]
MSNRSKEHRGGSGMENTVHRIPPYHFLHILDHSTNVTRVEKGPKTYVTSDTEVVVLGPEKMVVVPPCHYCTIRNPVARDEQNQIVVDTLNQIKLRHADLEIRLEQEPFPLYPGEQLYQDVTPLQVVPTNSAFRLRATRDFVDEGQVKRWAKDEWLFEGPGRWLLLPSLSFGVKDDLHTGRPLSIRNPENALKIKLSIKETPRINIRELSEDLNISFGTYQTLIKNDLHLKRSPAKFVPHLLTNEQKEDRKETCKNIVKMFNSDPHWLKNIITGNETWVYGYDPETKRQSSQWLEPGEPRFKKSRMIKSKFKCFLITFFDVKGLVHYEFEPEGTYIPRKEVEVVETIVATVIKPNQALKLRAEKETKDRDGNQRVAGEEWLVKKVGAYLPGAYEEIMDIVEAHVLTEKEAIHVKATRTFTDEFGKQRKNGEEWLVTMEDTETYIPSVYVQVVGLVPIVTLSNRQYCVILDPVNAETGKPQLGQKKLVKGEKSFFLQPGEKLEAGIQDIYVLGETEGLILRAREGFTDDTVDPPVVRKPGDKWMICGPAEFIPLITTEVVTKRYAIPLDDTEGIYVRDIKTGKVRAICGKSYMLTQDEELWNKELPKTVEHLLQKNALADRGMRSLKSGSSGFSGAPDPSNFIPPRDKSRVVTYQVPHNGAVQLYDYKEKKSRVVFGPDLVMLQPDEQFTELSLSGGKPKVPNEIRTLCLLLGPDFCTDRVTVETADHARLMLQLAYNWHFNVGEKSIEIAARLFSVPDFVGDMCKAIASRIRGAVAAVNFDHFHKNSARIIHEAVFGFDEKRQQRHHISFPQNNLNITSVDIQSVEPVDQRTRDALQKSVQLAIEITTSSQEATARHEAQRQEQEAKGRLARQKIEDEVKAERSRLELLDLQSQSQTVEACGQSKAEALARAESCKIEGETAVQQAKLKAEANTIKEAKLAKYPFLINQEKLTTDAFRADNELELVTRARQAELAYELKQNELEVSKSKELAAIDANKFKSMVDAIGQDTIRSIASAGPELQVKLLQSLGLQSTLITDGKTPLSLFNTALGFLSRPEHGN